ncbi:MAG: toxin TcdB middle/N-terminal domain-containing protein, partial [Myxococcota bacterium]
THVASARVEGERGTFRYHLVEMVDVYGHVVRYSYRRSGRLALLERVGWVYQGDTPRYSVALTYEDRSDGSGEAFLSDAKPGFNVLLTERLRRIEVYSGVDMIRRYELGYDSYAESGGFTRLTSVKQYGLTGELYPAQFTFRYSRALGGVCDDEEGCARAFMVDMGRLGVNLGSGRATLLDINGDALPDMLYTPEDGSHQFFMNIPDVTGMSRFQTPPVFSEVGGSSHQLGRPTSQVLDVDGDGFTDLLNTVNGQVLINRGVGDWTELTQWASSAALPDFSADFDFDEGQLGSIRFVDYNGDKRIDVIRATSDATSVFQNTEVGFQADPGAENLGVGFPSGDLDLTDMNGDGLLDVVRILPGELTYRLNLGWGQWGSWRSLNTVPYEASEQRLVRLEDINGDALADVVIVSGDEVRYALNRNGSDFFSTTTLTSEEVEGTIPARDDTTDILFADMNGNGSSDVVWVTNNGHVRYLELFPVRPNLLSRIENGLGHVTEIAYATSLQHAARDEEPWDYKLPHPMLVVDKTETWDTLSGIRETTQYRYRNGFYDGVEKQFRGYERVEAYLAGDAHHESGLTVSHFDVGATDPYSHGLLQRREVRSADRPLLIEEKSYADCPLEHIPSAATLEAEGRHPIRYLCMTTEQHIHQEGAAPEDWRTTESTLTYDGYGNITRSAKLGVVSLGSGACAPCERDPSIFGAPCGEQCLGDELFTETAFVSPEDTGGRWILHAPYQVRTYGREGSERVKEQRYYYDGEAFEGLPLGQLTRGDLTRSTERVDVGGDAVITTQRNRYDGHGNVVETLDPNGTPDAHRNRRQYTLDADNLRIIATDILLEDGNGSPYVLRRETRYEPLFDLPVESTGWMRVVDNEVLTARRSRFYQYDGFGRQSRVVKPGDDTLNSPTEAYTYDLGDPVSRTITHRRTTSDGPMDQERIVCMDGRGRTFQERTRLDEGRYQV